MTLSAEKQHVRPANSDNAPVAVARGLATETSPQGVGRVFEDTKPVFFCQGGNLIHATGLTGEVDGDDDLG